MNSFNYKYLLLLLAGALFAGCMEDQEEDKENRDDYHLKVRVAYSQLPGSTRAATDTTNAAGVVWLTNEVCLEAKVNDWSSPQTAQANIPQTRGALMEIAENITDLNLIMLTGTYPGSITKTKVFEVKNKKDGDFTLTAPKSETGWAEGEPDPRSFFAIAPIAVQTENGIELATDSKSLTYTVPTEVEKQPDLLVSTFGPTDTEFNKNIKNEKKSYRNNLTLTMNHVLTAVGFEAVGWDLKITKVTLSKIKQTGTLSLEDRTWSNVSGDETMSPIIKDDQWMLSNNKNEMENVTKNEGYLMMVPQELNDDAVITIEFEGKGEQPGGKYEVPLKSIVAQWKPGKKIIYQLRLKTRPAVRTDELIIYNFQEGYTSEKPLEVVADADDNLTFTWDKPWLKIHRGAPGFVNPVTGGATSGWKTGVNNWKNLYFFATSENTSLYNSREATVTVSGKKSGIRTFKVTHFKKWKLRLQNEGTIYIRTFRPGTMSTANYAWIEGDVPAKISYSIRADKLGNGPGDRDWITINPWKSGNNTYFDLKHKWNVQANRRRTATVTVTATYGSYQQSKSFKIEQYASSYFIVLDNNSNFQVAFYAHDLGRYYAAEEYRCGSQGPRLLYIHEIRNHVGHGVTNGYWVNRANFKSDRDTGDHYWTSTEAKNIFGRRFDNYWFGGGSFNCYNTVWFRKNVEWYRCAQPNQSAVY